MSDDFGFWDVIVSMFWFMLLVAWISLFFRIIGDIFRDRELNGVAKAGWTVLLVFLPWIGALAYLLARGDSMNRRTLQAQADNAESYRSYVREVAGSAGPADELRKLAELRDSGVIDAEDYEKAKAKVLA
jgi:Short C-terminal domain/Phospholipase_D-nuclease N-terminal